MNLIVENISHRVSENHLKKLFQPFGEVLSVKLNKNRYGESDGTAIIEMEKETDGRIAMNELNGCPLDGKYVKIQKIKQRKPRASKK